MKWIWTALALACVGCGPSTVEVSLTFPALDAFVFTDSARLLAYDVDLSNPEEDCPAVLQRIAAGSFGQPVLDTDWEPVCSFRDGGTSIDEIPTGPHTYVVVARDAANVVLLTGCRIAEVYRGAPVVEVSLFPTSEYADSIDGRVSSCASEEDKCGGDC